MEFKIYQLPYFVLRQIIQSCDFTSVVNLARCHVVFYRLIGINFKQLCLDNVIPRWPGETWAEAFLEAPQRLYEKHNTRTRAAIPYIVEKNPVNDTVVMFEKESNVAILWFLDMTKGRSTVKLELTQPISTACFTHDGKRVVFCTTEEGNPVSEPGENLRVEVLDVRSVNFVMYAQFYDESLHLVEVGGGVIWDQLNQELYNYREGTCVEMPYQYHVPTPNDDRVLSRAVYSYVNSTTEAMVIWVQKSEFALYNFHSRTWRNIDLGCVDILAECIPSYMYCFNARTSQVLTTGKDCERLFVINLEGKTAKEVPAVEKKCRQLRFLHKRGNDVTVFVEIPNTTAINVYVDKGTFWRTQRYSLQKPRTAVVEPAYTVNKELNNPAFTWGSATSGRGRHSANFVDDGYRRFFVLPNLMGKPYVVSTGPYLYTPRRWSYKDLDTVIKRCAPQVIRPR